MQLVCRCMTCWSGKMLHFVNEMIVATFIGSTGEMSISIHSTETDISRLIGQLVEATIVLSRLCDSERVWFEFVGYWKVGLDQIDTERV